MHYQIKAYVMKVVRVSLALCFTTLPLRYQVRAYVMKVVRVVLVQPGDDA